MERKYLVGNGDSPFEEQEFSIVNAVDEQEAISKYARAVSINEDVFIEHVYARSLNMSFAEHFWLQSDEELRQFSETPRAPISVDEFEKRVRQFFGFHADFANLYLDYMFDDDQDWNERHTIFPDDMLLYIWLNSRFWRNRSVRVRRH